MTFSIITPSFNQLDWLRLCVASVRDQVEEKAETGKLKGESGGMNAETIPNQTSDIRFQASNFKFQVSPPLAVEHIIQDAGSPGIEDFAREVGADFYRDGVRVFDARRESNVESPERSASASTLGPRPSALLPPSTPDPRRYRIAIYCESDSGMYDAINRGLARSTGKTCAYLNCDEQYLPGALSLVESWFDSNPDVEWMYADAILVDESGTPISYRRTCAPSAVHIRLCHLNTLSCSTFFKRHLVDEGFLFDTRYRAMGDAEWVYRIVRARRKVGAMREATSVFTLTGDNLGTTTASLKEAAAWRREKSAPPTWLTLPCKIMHRMGKVFAGAYQGRTISISLYTKTSPLKRVNAQTKSLGFGWPTKD